MTDCKGMLEMKQEDWIQVCKEIDVLNTKLAIAVEALEKYESAFQTVDAQIRLKPEFLKAAWNRQMLVILGDAREALAKIRGEG